MLGLRKILSGNPSRFTSPAQPFICRVDRRHRSEASNNFPVSKGAARFQRPELRNVRREDGGIGKYLLLIIPASTFCLGCWQIERKKWKEDLLAKLALKTKAEPVPLPTELSEVRALEYSPVRVKGVFHHNHELYLGPRSCLNDEGQSVYEGKLMSTAANTSSGYLVITPFTLSDTRETILVNRGWVPFQKKKPSTRPEGQIEGEVELEGIVRLTEPRPQFSPGNKDDVRVWFYRDVEKMADLLGCSPIFLDACAQSTVPGGPIGGQTRSSLRNEHFSYIVTWFSLSAATSVMWYMKYIKKTW